MSISINEIFDDYKHQSPYVVSLDKANRVAAKQTISSEAHTNMTDTLFLVCICLFGLRLYVPVNNFSVMSGRTCLYCYFIFFKLYGNFTTMNDMEHLISF